MGWFQVGIARPVLDINRLVQGFLYLWWVLEYDDKDNDDSDEDHDNDGWWLGW